MTGGKWQAILGTRGVLKIIWPIFFILSAFRNRMHILPALYALRGEMFTCGMAGYRASCRIIASRSHSYTFPEILKTVAALICQVQCKLILFQSMCDCFITMMSLTVWVAFANFAYSEYCAWLFTKDGSHIESCMYIWRAKEDSSTSREGYDR